MRWKANRKRTTGSHACAKHGRVDNENTSTMAVHRTRTTLHRNRTVGRQGSRNFGLVYYYDVILLHRRGFWDDCQSGLAACAVAGSVTYRSSHRPYRHGPYGRGIHASAVTGTTAT